MRTLLIIPVFGALAAAAVGAAAQDSSAQAPQDQQAISEIRVSPPPSTIRMWPNEMHEVAGLYPMSQGQWFKLSVKGQRLYAQLNDRPWTQVTQIRPNVLVSKEQSMTMVVNYGPYSDQVRLTYLPDQGTASVDAVPVTVTLAAR